MTGIVKKILLSSGIAFSALAGSALPPEDSIKVVKGQVSDYYIPVVNQYEITGTVVDEQGNPLEGATVMFFSSPVHLQLFRLFHIDLLPGYNNRLPVL